MIIKIDFNNHSIIECLVKLYEFMAKVSTHR